MALPCVEIAQRFVKQYRRLHHQRPGQRHPLLLTGELVTELGIAAEEMGLSSGCARKLVSRDDANPEIAASRLRWREERRWLHQHRAELAKLAVQLYPAEYRLPRTAVLAHPEWLAGEPMELGSLALRLDEGPQTVEVDGTEPESELTRPLRTAGLRFEPPHHRPRTWLRSGAGSYTWRLYNLALLAGHPG